MQPSVFVYFFRYAVKCFCLLFQVCCQVFLFTFSGMLSSVFICLFFSVMLSCLVYGYIAFVFLYYDMYANALHL